MTEEKDLIIGEYYWIEFMNGNREVAFYNPYGWWDLCGTDQSVHYNPDLSAYSKKYYDVDNFPKIIAHIQRP